MKIFYHHVGKEGAEEDFPKTIHNEIDIQFIDENLADNLPLKHIIIDELKNAFPNGKFNVWGVPSGAAAVIKRMSVGDYVFLVENASNSIHSSGSVPILGRIEVFHFEELPQFSIPLWGKVSSYISFSSMLNKYT